MDVPPDSDAPASDDGHHPGDPASNEVALQPPRERPQKRQRRGSWGDRFKSRENPEGDDPKVLWQTITRLLEENQKQKQTIDRQDGELRQSSIRESRLRQDLESRDSHLVPQPIVKRQGDPPSVFMVFRTAENPRSSLAAGECKDNRYNPYVVVNPKMTFQRLNGDKEEFCFGPESCDSNRIRTLLSEMTTEDLADLRSQVHGTVAYLNHPLCLHKARCDHVAESQRARGLNSDDIEFTTEDQLESGAIMLAIGDALDEPNQPIRFLHKPPRVKMEGEGYSFPNGCFDLSEPGAFSENSLALGDMIHTATSEDHPATTLTELIAAMSRMGLSVQSLRDLIDEVAASRKSDETTLATTTRRFR
jgi:hypothetical protein